MSQIDRVLAVLDVGLQASTERGYGTDCSPTTCSRCQHEQPVEGGDLCVGCRAFLLGDTDDDPIKPPALSQSGIAALIEREGLVPPPREPIPSPRVNHANGHLVVGGSMEGSRIAVEGRVMEVPIYRPMDLRVWTDDDPDPVMPTFAREVYRREPFHMRDTLMWMWVHQSLTGDQAAQRIVDMNIC